MFSPPPYLAYLHQCFLQSVSNPCFHATFNPCVLQSVSDPCLYATSNPCVLQSVSDPCFHVSSCLLLMSPRVPIQCFHVYPSNVSSYFFPISPRVSFQCLLPMSPRVFFQRLCISPSNVSICLLLMFPRVSFLSTCMRVSFQCLHVSPSNVSFQCLPMSPISPSKVSACLRPRTSFKCFSFEIYPGMMFNALSPLTMLRYYFHYLPLVLLPQCLHMSPFNVFTCLLPMSACLLLMFLLLDLPWNDV